MPHSKDIITTIVKQSESITVFEKRAVSDTYCEFVVFNRDMERWYKVFASVLGEAIKPANVKPAKEHLVLTKPYGAIYPDQTLFKTDCDNASVIGMFWPWQDSTHTTLKVAVVTV